MSNLQNGQRLSSLHRSAAIASSMLFGALSFACSGPMPGTDSEPPATKEQAILNGSKDASHLAVQALIHASRQGAGGCTGTIIAVKGQSGLMLTAGHCIVEIDPTTQSPRRPIQLVDKSELVVVPSANWLEGVQASQYFTVVEATPHPAYDGSLSTPDIAVVRFVGANDKMPIIPYLKKAEDKLAVETKLTLVGYGITESNQQNTERYSVEQEVARLDTRRISFDQSNGKGTCSGDSGGPALFATPNGDRVAGITSFGDAGCQGFGVSTRVSAFEEFVQGHIDNMPDTLSCDDCMGAAIAPENPCNADASKCAGETTECAKFVQCASACNGATAQTCVRKCSEDHAEGLKQYRGVIECNCKTCGSSCSGDERCSALQCGGFGDSDPDRNACLQNTCCAQAKACGEDSACAECAGSTTGTNCASNANLKALRDCIASCPGNPFGVPGAGGATGAGGSSNTAGTTGSGGSSGTPRGTNPRSGSGSSDSDSGCSCSVPQNTQNGNAPWLAALFGAMLLFRRRFIARRSAAQLVS